MYSESFVVSSSPMPIRHINPFDIEETTLESTVTEAEETRWMTARMSNSGRKNSKGAVPNQVQLGAAENLVNKKSKVRCCITDALTKLMVTPCWLVIAGDGANSD